MREINVARDLVRTHLDRLAEPYVSLAPTDGRSDGFPFDLDPDALADLGVQWSSNARRIPWATRVRAARLSLGVVKGDEVTVEENGTLRVGRVTAFDETTRVGLRTNFQGIPVEVRRVGLDVQFPDEETRTVDAAHVQAAGWRCPVCLRTSPHGIPRTRPCPRCLRRFRAGYERWRETAVERRRLRRRLTRLEGEPADFSPRRYPTYRQLDAALTDARERAASIESTRDTLGAALAEEEAAEQAAEARLGRTRSETGAAKRRVERDRHAAEARRVRTILDALARDADDAYRTIVELTRSLDELERELRLRHAAAEQVRHASAERRNREIDELRGRIRALDLELGALNPDAPALLDGFDAWGEDPDHWLR